MQLGEVAAADDWTSGADEEVVETPNGAILEANNVRAWPMT